VTQPSLTRRGFLAAITAAVLAGPRALASLLEQHRQPALVFSIDYPPSVVCLNRMHLQNTYRKMQAKALEGLQWQTEEWDTYTKVADAPSGFRAWSQRHPS
jgi:hypothetical protein